jgi:deoxyribodipyrimidine photo-lyase
MANQVNIFWFRRDLRLHDNTGLHHALKAGKPVIPIFIFDRDILDKLDNIEDRRVEFIHQQVEHIQQQLISLNSSLDVFYGRPMKVFEDLLKKYDVDAVFVNDDYEPYARQRDLMISEFLKASGKSYHSFKDHVIFEKEEVMKDDGSPYTIFTPYSKKWKFRLNDIPLSLYPIEPFSHVFFEQKPIRVPTLSEIGFKASGLPFPE